METNVWQAYRDKGVVVLGINLEESISLVQSYINSKNLTFPNLVNGYSQFSLYANGYIPYNVILDKDRIIKYSTSGFNSSAILSLLNTLTTGIQESESISPEDYKLFQNYPNPFNPDTEIEFFIPKSGFVRLAVYRTDGSLVKVLISDEMPAGLNNIIWDGTNESGDKVSSGIYIYRIQVGKFTAARKTLLLK